MIFLDEHGWVRGHKMIYIDLLIGFLEVGLFSFGGGYAAIPLIRDVVTAHGWLDDEMLTYMIAVSESTPGPIMVNLATYVGSAKAGILGAVTATAAVVFPAFILIVIIVRLASNLVKNSYVQAALGGLKPCIIGIILATGICMVWQNCAAKTGTGAESEVSRMAAAGAEGTTAGLAAEGVSESFAGLGIDIRAVLLTFVLGAVYFGSRKLLKRGISPIGLICIAAAAGAAVYGV